MICGHLNRIVATGKPDALMGEVDLAGTLAGFICLIKNAEKRGQKSPDWVVKFRPDKDVQWATIGGAWDNQTKTGEPCIGLLADAPFLNKPVQLTAYVSENQPKDTKSGKEANWVLRWKRRTLQARSAAETAVADLRSDGVPY